MFTVILVRLPCVWRIISLLRSVLLVYFAIYPFVFHIEFGFSLVDYSATSRHQFSI